MPQLEGKTSNGPWSRRALLLAGAAGGLGLRLRIARAADGANRPDDPFFKTRGVVITPEDVTLGDWPERAGRAGLTTIALHPFPGKVLEFVHTEAGIAFLERCRGSASRSNTSPTPCAELLPRGSSRKTEACSGWTRRGTGSRTPISASIPRGHSPGDELRRLRRRRLPARHGEPRFLGEYGDPPPVHAPTVTDLNQYGKEIFFDEIPSWFTDDTGFDWNDMRANNQGQAFGDRLHARYHPFRNYLRHLD